ncbi:exosome complex component RRP40 [Patella vulgata]|uniref:exosome complex component RRP40 n=1 Tax=Patella vulgata TaxID=6465 RepID=UPI00218067A5|nr:exosome complex component RRP40 [Patella vulgata]
MADHVGSLFLPGDLIQNLKESEATKKILLGPGLRQENDLILASKPGILRFREPNVYWIDSPQKRYVPVKGDAVLGIVTQKMGDVFRVDVGASEAATLPYIAFEGATKRNRPDVKVGDIVFARFSVANKDMEAELVCIDKHGRSNGMGVIRDGGFLHHCSINQVRKILNPENVLLKTLGKNMKFETAVGMNGRVWVKGRNINETIAIINALAVSEFMTNEQILSMCKKLADSLAGF